MKALYQKKFKRPVFLFDSNHTRAFFLPHNKFLDSFGLLLHVFLDANILIVIVLKLRIHPRIAIIQLRHLLFMMLRFHIGCSRQRVQIPLVGCESEIDVSLSHASKCFVLFLHILLDVFLNLVELRLHTLRFVPDRV